LGFVSCMWNKNSVILGSVLFSSAVEPEISMARNRCRFHLLTSRALTFSKRISSFLRCHSYCPTAVHTGINSQVCIVIISFIICEGNSPILSCWDFPDDLECLPSSISHFYPWSSLVSMPKLKGYNCRMWQTTLLYDRLG
jgi:hypothetical protein